MKGNIVLVKTDIQQWRIYGDGMLIGVSYDMMDDLEDLHHMWERAVDRNGNAKYTVFASFYDHMVMKVEGFSARSCNSFLDIQNLITRYNLKPEVEHAEYDEVLRAFPLLQY